MYMLLTQVDTIPCEVVLRRVRWISNRTPCTYDQRLCGYMTRFQQRYAVEHLLTYVPLELYSLRDAALAAATCVLNIFVGLRRERGQG